MVHPPVALPKILLREVNFTNLPCTLVRIAVRTYSLHYKYFLRPLLGWEQEKLCLRGRLKISARIRLRTTSFSLGCEIRRTLIREQNWFSVTGMDQYAVCSSLTSSWFFIDEFTFFFVVELLFPRLSKSFWRKTRLPSLVPRPLSAKRLHISVTGTRQDLGTRLAAA